MKRRMLIGGLAAIPLASMVRPRAAEAATMFPWVNASYYSSPQAAVNAAPAGAVVLFPRGTYVGNLTVTKSLTLQGEGNPPSYLNGVSGDVDGTGSRIVGNVLVEPPSGTMIHVGLRDIGVQGGVRLRAVSALSAVEGWAFDNVRVWESAGAGISLEGNIFQGHMRNVYSGQNAGDGLSTQDVGGGIVGEIEIDACRFFANGGRGVYLASGGNITFGQVSASYNQREGFVSYGTRFDAQTIHLESNALDGTTGRAAWLYAQKCRIGALRVSHGGVDADGVALTGCTGVRIGQLTGNAAGSRKDLLIDGNSLRCTVEDYWPEDGTLRFTNGGYQCEVRQGGILLG